MDNQLSSRSHQTLSREKLLYRYTNALAREDIETMAAILQLAEEDEILEQMITEVHELNRPPEAELFYQEDTRLLQSIIQSQRPERGPSPLASEKKSESKQTPSTSGLCRRLKEVGLGKEFIMRRLVPSYTAPLPDEPDKERALGVAAMVERIFGWKPGSIFASTDLAVNATLVGTTRFKRDERSNLATLEGYTAYAYYLAILVLKATAERAQKPVPTEASTIRRDILAHYGSLSFEHVLRYIWDLGIPVLPLQDKEAFHGACWRVASRNVIVLTLRTLSDIRLIFDLLHELRHAGQAPEQSQFATIETDQMYKLRQKAEEEQTASRFAGDVLLDGRAEDLARQCVDQAHGHIERLKRVVPLVARREQVSTAALANYLAFRLSLQNIDWWGTATNLQEPGDTAGTTARAMLLQQCHLEMLEEEDHALLLQALAEKEA
jgi:Zn-dependent peptidase ImmA (M78 family)